MADGAAMTGVLCIYTIHRTSFFLQVKVWVHTTLSFKISHHSDLYALLLWPSLSLRRHGRTFIHKAILADSSCVCVAPYLQPRVGTTLSRHIGSFLKFFKLGRSITEAPSDVLCIDEHGSKRLCSCWIWKNLNQVEGALSCWICAPSIQKVLWEVYVSYC